MINGKVNGSYENKTAEKLVIDYTYSLNIIYIALTSVLPVFSL